MMDDEFDWLLLILLIFMGAILGMTLQKYIGII